MRKRNGIILLISFVAIAVVLFIKHGKELELFSDDFLIGFVFWIAGWWLTLTSSGVSISQRIWKLGGLWPQIVYRGRNSEKRNVKVAEGARFSGVLFMIFGWLLMAADLWR